MPMQTHAARSGRGTRTPLFTICPAPPQATRAHRVAASGQPPPARADAGPQGRGGAAPAGPATTAPFFPLPRTERVERGCAERANLRIVAGGVDAHGLGLDDHIVQGPQRRIGRQLRRRAPPQRDLRADVPDGAADRGGGGRGFHLQPAATGAPGLRPGEIHAQQQQQRGGGADVATPFTRSTVFWSKRSGVSSAKSSAIFAAGRVRTKSPAPARLSISAPPQRPGAR